MEFAPQPTPLYVAQVFPADTAVDLPTVVYGLVIGWKQDECRPQRPSCTPRPVLVELRRDGRTEPPRLGFGEGAEPLWNENYTVFLHHELPAVVRLAVGAAAEQIADQAHRGGLSPLDLVRLAHHCSQTSTQVRTELSTVALHATAQTAGSTEITAWLEAAERLRTEAVKSAHRSTQEPTLVVRGLETVTVAMRPVHLAAGFVLGDEDGLAEEVLLLRPNGPNGETREYLAATTGPCPRYVLVAGK